MALSGRQKHYGRQRALLNRQRVSRDRQKASTGPQANNGPSQAVMRGHSLTALRTDSPLKPSEDPFRLTVGPSGPQRAPSGCVFASNMMHILTHIPALLLNDTSIVSGPPKFGFPTMSNR